MLGQPVSIRDEDIEAALPSAEGLPEAFANDFQHGDGAIAGLRIARLAAEITSFIYVRSMQQDSFPSRVQQALKKLDDWTKDVFGSLRTKANDVSDDADMTDIMVHFYYNQVRA